MAMKNSKYIKDLKKEKYWYFTFILFWQEKNLTYSYIGKVIILGRMEWLSFYVLGLKQHICINK